MPKLKTKRGAAKRFAVTGTGKIKRRRAFLRHINSHMPRKRKRRLRRAALVDPADVRTVRRLLPYGA